MNWGIITFLPFTSLFLNMKRQKFDEQTKDITPSQEGIIQETQWRKDIYLCISHNFWLSQGGGREHFNICQSSANCCSNAWWLPSFNSCSTAQNTELKVLHPLRPRCSHPLPQQTSSLQFGKAPGESGSRGLLHCLWSWRSTAEWMHHYRPALTNSA